MNTKLTNREQARPRLDLRSAGSRYPKESLACFGISATELAIGSSILNGRDVLVGTVILEGNRPIGADYSADMLYGDPEMHSINRALIKASKLNKGATPRAIITTVEPTEPMLEFIAKTKSIREVGFILGRQTLVEAGLVRPHDEDAFQIAERLDLPFSIYQIGNRSLELMNQELLAFTSRDLSSGEVSVDSNGLSEVMGRIVNLTVSI